MLQLIDISKQYKTGELVQQALDGVSFCLRDSEFVSVLGPSGSGKTTMLRCLSFLETADGGRVIFDGKEYDLHHSSKKDILNYRIALE